jgi:predicted phosphodiesterase
MRYGIISDIHGNREALDAAVRHLTSVGVDEFVCVGDIVGYGADPNTCMETVRNLTEKTVAGNHDYAAVGLTDIEHFNQYAREAAVWTAARLKATHSSYIKELPLTFSLEKALVVHSTPHQPHQWFYLITHFQFLAAFQHFSEKICFIGHSHQPLVFEKGKNSSGPVDGSVFQLNDASRYVVNVGSVGQPRDNDSRLCCCLYDSNEMTVELVRLEYDVEQAQDKIRKAGLPEFLAKRLAFGE